MDYMRRSIYKDGNYQVDNSNNKENGKLYFSVRVVCICVNCYKFLLNRRQLTLNRLNLCQISLPFAD